MNKRERDAHNRRARAVRRGFTGYVLLHKPSDMWNPGHSTLKVYHDPSDARAAVQDWTGETWVPVEVIVKERAR